MTLSDFFIWSMMGFSVFSLVMFAYYKGKQHAFQQASKLLTQISDEERAKAICKQTMRKS